MTALVVLYMVNQLLLPGHVENIAGFPAFRAALERVFGPMSTQALASQIFGLYSGFVYFTPVLGGWDCRSLRRSAQRCRRGRGADERRPPGHGVRPELPPRPGAASPRQRTPEGQHLRAGGRAVLVDDEANRVRGYTVFSMGINVGAVFGPIVCGLLVNSTAGTRGSARPRCSS